MDDRSPTSTSAQGAALSTGRDPALDGVRGLAILIVVFHNASWIQESRATLPLKLFMATTAVGWVGVTLFFVLSGLLITSILLDTREEPNYFGSFYLRRTLRIFPLYYAFLALVFFIGPRVVHDAAWVASVHEKQPWYWFYLSNYVAPIDGLPHFWSLAVEEQFYLVWPLLVWLLAERRLLPLCLVMIATDPFIRLGLRFTPNPRHADYEYTMSRWDALAIGAVIAILLRHSRGREWLERYGWRVALSTFAILVTFVAFNRGFHDGEPMVDIVGQTLDATLFGALLAMVVAPPGAAGQRLRHLLSARWLRMFGKYSYAIYVFHATLHRVVRSYFASFVNQGGTWERLARVIAYDLGILGASTLLALVSWHLLEKHALRLRDRIARQRPAGLQVPLATAGTKVSILRGG